jgi:hypothetical protein
VVVSGEKTPNFPSCYPLFYHNITEEIPIHSQWFLRLCLLDVIIFLVLGPVNFIACCTSGQFDEPATQNVVFSIIIGLLTGPVAFRVTYKKMYFQAKSDEFSLWGMCLKALLFAWILIGAIGIRGSGMAGIAMSISAFGAGTASGFAKAMVVITTMLYVGAALMEFFTLGRLLLLFKGTGPRIDTIKETKYTQLQ